jgi:hypothetical protein
VKYGATFLQLPHSTWHLLLWRIWKQSDFSEALITTKFILYFFVNMYSQVPIYVNIKMFIFIYIFIDDIKEVRNKRDHYKSCKIW